MVPERFSGATHKEPPCFAAECGPDPFGHTRALRRPFSSELGWELSSAGFRVSNNYCILSTVLSIQELLRNTCNRTCAYSVNGCNYVP